MIDYKLYVITNRHLCYPKTLLTVISEIIEVGVEAIQLREKDLDSLALYELASSVSKICEKNCVDLFINTNVKVAIDVGAAGVHLPDIDVSVEEVRIQSDRELIVGCSIHDITAAKKREFEGADFVTYSPIYPVISKPEYGPVVGVENLAVLVKQVTIPVYALGGITPGNVGECLNAGASGVAVMSGIMTSTGAAEHTEEYLKAYHIIPN